MRLAIMACLVLAGMATSVQAGRACKNVYYQGSNAALLTGHRQSLARENAIASWEVRVTASIGPLYANWNKARRTSIRCVRQNGRLKCTARAQPCRDK